MSRQNVELVKVLQGDEADLVEMFAGEAPALPSDFDPAPYAEDFEVEFVSNLAGDRRPSYRGFEGFAQGWRDWLEPYASYRTKVEEYIDAGDKVVVFARVQATTARDGVAVEHHPAVVWTLDGGRVVAIRMYLDRKDALQEAGVDAEPRSAQQPSR